MIDWNDRFWSKVSPEPNSGCWLWVGASIQSGYGLTTVGFPRRVEYAHRHAYYLKSGFYPRLVRHTCDVPACVNPAHLLAGTQADNMRDASERGRLNPPGLKGTEHGCAKLTESDVMDIRECVRRGEKQQAMAVLYGVSATTISRIVRRKGWRHI